MLFLHNMAEVERASGLVKDGDKELGSFVATGSN
jgi:hypothetical protein